MMFSSHIDMIYNNSALQVIFVKLLFIGIKIYDVFIAHRHDI